jgi:hypothetical protein
MNMIVLSVLNSPMQNAHATDGLAIYIQLNCCVLMSMPPYMEASTPKNDHLAVCIWLEMDLCIRIGYVPGVVDNLIIIGHQI